MKIHILSDLHNEFELFTPSQVASEADVVVLAGDIHVKSRGVEWARNVFSCPVIYVPGNHEYFREHIENTLEKMRAASFERVRVLDNDAWVINGVRFLGATCWTDYSSTGNAILAKYEAIRGLNDYQKIRTAGYRKVMPDDLALRNQLSLAWLRERLAEPFEGQTVVVTHHAPSLISMGHPPLSERSVLDSRMDNIGESSENNSTDFKPTHPEVPHIAAAYANGWESMMGESIALWVHGHVHRAADWAANGTRVVCNPRGYPGEKTGFNPDLLITVER